MLSVTVHASAKEQSFRKTLKCDQVEHCEMKTNYEDINVASSSLKKSGYLKRNFYSMPTIPSKQIYLHIRFSQINLILIKLVLSYYAFFKTQFNSLNKYFKICQSTHIWESCIHYHPMIKIIHFSFSYLLHLCCYFMLMLC